MFFAHPRSAVRLEDDWASSNQHLLNRWYNKGALSFSSKNTLKHLPHVFSLPPLSTEALQHIIHLWGLRGVSRVKLNSWWGGNDWKPRFRYSFVAADNAPWQSLAGCWTKIPVLWMLPLRKKFRSWEPSWSHVFTPSSRSAKSRNSEFKNYHP